MPYGIATMHEKCLFDWTIPKAPKLGQLLLFGNMIGIRMMLDIHCQGIAKIFFVKFGLTNCYQIY